MRRVRCSRIAGNAAACESIDGTWNCVFRDADFAAVDIYPAEGLVFDLTLDCETYEHDAFSVDVGDGDIRTWPAGTARRYTIVGIENVASPPIEEESEA